MEINYQETSKDLLTRIDIHEKYGSANIDQWTTDLLQPRAGMNILDIGCGAGELSLGSAVAAVLIEALAGVDYRDFLRQRVIEPRRVLERGVDAEADDRLSEAKGVLRLGRRP